ncbi:hypothetical protein [Variovorax sp. OV329]|uniref:hypothetical protein n=1 Tax=Variovorax sp. OV329 TaxID=1882825 RepID=UPI0008E8799C|nr:hypothetical protein [Variovorax sp. OV329]SFM78355.1 hypothetical protein SAMN05444747_108269 [Variovorax sp. OV329]
MKKTILCTLFEGHYHYGVAALANSLLANGFRGDLWVGYRGQLAGWITESGDYSAATGQLRLSEQFSLRFVKLDTPVFFTYYKATFMRDLLDKHAPEADVVAYIDPDIVLKCPWADIAPWFEGGIALIEDVNWNFPPRHPKRLMWKSWFAPHGVVQRRELDRYYNAGFISVPREHADFLTLWGWMCGLVADYNTGLKNIKSGNAPDLFHSTDQDALNFALTAHEAPLNTAGADAMDFLDGGYYFSHAIGSAKPWLGKHLQRALGGRPPSPATKAYYRFANHPIQLYSPLQFTLRRASLGLASAIGRFYRKA